MSYYVVNLTYVGTLPSEVRAAQQAHLATMAVDGTLMWSGPFSDGLGGMAILRADSEADARSLYSQTPLATAEAITWELRGWDGRAGVVAGLLSG